MTSPFYFHRDDFLIPAKVHQVVSVHGPRVPYGNGTASVAGTEFRPRLGVRYFIEQAVLVPRGTEQHSRLDLVEFHFHGTDPTGPPHPLLSVEMVWAGRPSYNKPRPFNETNSPSLPTTTWSSSSIPSNSPTSASFFVKPMSSLEGVGSPLGWL